MTQVVISGTGVYTPQQKISNEELVASFNQYVENFNEQHKQQIASQEIEPLKPSSTEFIEKASGIKSRYVVDKEGILNNETMAPRLNERNEDDYSLQAEMGIKAAEQALKNANKQGKEVDAVILSCIAMERAYPSVAVEIQQALQVKGFAFDMMMACASAPYAMQVASDMISCGHAKSILVVSAEIMTAHVNFKDRDSHFIFGDAAAAYLLESEDTCTSEHPFKIIDSKLISDYSNRIRNNFGFLNRTNPKTASNPDKWFRQQGRQVFKEVVPMVANLVSEHLSANNLTPQDIKRFWLHQANINMNQLIIKKLLGKDVSPEQAPLILDQYANTSSAGCMIAFHNNHQDLSPGNYGLISAFGAGYGAGSIIIQKA